MGLRLGLARHHEKVVGWVSCARYGLEVVRSAHPTTNVHGSPPGLKQPARRKCDMPETQKLEHLKKLATLMRDHTTMTTQAGSGHPTSSLSATELMAGLMFGGIFRYDVDHPGHPNNDRPILSKGHATPLFYTLWAMAGKATVAELIDLPPFRQPPGRPPHHELPLHRGGHRLPGAGPIHRLRRRFERQVPGQAALHHLRALRRQ